MGKTKQTEAPGREGTWLQSQSESVLGSLQGLLSFVVDFFSFNKYKSDLKWYPQCEKSSFYF